MQKLNDLSRCLTTLEPEGTADCRQRDEPVRLLVAGIVLRRAPAVKEAQSRREHMLNLLHRWREEAQKAGLRIKRISVAFEAGVMGLASALAQGARHRGPCHHASSVAVSREHRRAKTDRLDSELLKRAFSVAARRA